MIAFPNPIDAMHLSQLLLLVVLIVVVTQAVYVLGPLKLHDVHRVQIHRRTRSMTPADEQRADPALLAYVAQGERALAAAGFGAPHRIVHHESPTMFTFASLLEHPAGDLATVMAIRNTEASPNVVAAVTIEGAGANGWRVVTSNVASVKRFPTRGAHDAALFPTFTDGGELYALHQFRMKAATRAATPLTRGATDRDRLDYQDADARAHYDHWVASGYFYETPDFLRLTWKGAAFSTWRGLFPWRQVSEWRRDRKSAEILREYRAVSGAA